MDLFGLFPLGEGLLCKGEALKEYHCTISGIDCTLYFPQYNKRENPVESVGLSNPLVAPSIARTWHRKGSEETFKWGYPTDYPDGNSSVSLLALSVDNTDKDIEETAFQIYDHFEAWKESFLNYCMLSGKQLKNRNHVSSGGITLELLSDKYIPPRNQSVVLSLSIISKEHYLSEQQITQACKFASSGKELHFAYQMLLSSYYAIQSNQNRLAIVDACSALEICLLEQIKTYCKKHMIKKDLLTKKYRSLEDHIELVTQIDSTFNSSHLWDRVAKQRNYVLHNRNNFPSNQTTDTLLLEVENVLSHFYSDYYKH